MKAPIDKRTAKDMKNIFSKCVEQAMDSINESLEADNVCAIELTIKIPRSVALKCSTKLKKQILTTKEIDV